MPDERLTSPLSYKRMQLNGQTKLRLGAFALLKLTTFRCSKVR